MKLVHEYLQEAAVRFPDKPAVICDERQLSYNEFMGLVMGLASHLVEIGARKGDRMLLLLGRKDDFLLAIYAAMAAGTIAVPLMEGAARRTIDELVIDCEPSILISTSRDLAPYERLHEKLNCKVVLMDRPEDGVGHITGGHVSRFDQSTRWMIGRNGKFPVLSDQDGALILYTSGTTGKKKGVLLTQRNLVQTVHNINQFMKIDEKIREFVAIPLTHSFGFGRSRCVLFTGGTLVVNNGMLNPVAVVQMIKKHRCDALSSVPSGFAMFLGRLEPMLRSIGQQIRFIEIGSSPMPLDHKMKLLEIFPNARICMHYGLTEASRSTFIEFRSEQRKLDSVGRPAPNVQAVILDEHERPLPPLHTGEIAVKGDHLTVGYWRNDELNSQRFTRDGWFKTGDLAFLDEDGYMHLLGRKDEIINMGGIKISPLEVEERIHESFPEYDICVVGVPDPAGIVGEIPVLCYSGRWGQRINPSELEKVLWNRLDRSKIPRIVYRFDSIPKTENGKILRHELRRLLREGAVHGVEERIASRLME
jgi:long-chain acyl-CoA synthetase